MIPLIPEVKSAGDTSFFEPYDEDPKLFDDKPNVRYPELDEF